MPCCAALIVAGGRGSRLGGALPKQYRTLARGQSVLRHALAPFLEHDGIAQVRVVIHEDDAPLYQKSINGLTLPDPVIGGATRSLSVLNGLEALEEARKAGGKTPFDNVLIHDAARPLAGREIVSRILKALAKHTGAVAAIPVADSLKKSDGRRILAAVDRKRLWQAQTPQGFHFTPLLNAYRTAANPEDATDDCAIAEASGMKVAVVAGEKRNFKITDEQDLALARAVLSGETKEPPLPPDMRTGTGFDVHRFGPGDKVILCGVAIPHGQALIGHSDADVALHAITDAILGALGEGDIGTHFPPSDPRWRGCDSRHFLEWTVKRVKAQGALIRHIDLTLICETPKIGPWRQAMRASLASVLNIPQERASVKATTSEGLGFTGRREGIAAQAAATLYFAPTDSPP